MFHVAGQNRPGVHCVISVNTGHCSPEIVRFTLKIVGYAGVYSSVRWTQCPPPAAFVILNPTFIMLDIKLRVSLITPNVSRQSLYETNYCP